MRDIEQTHYNNNGKITAEWYVGAGRKKGIYKLTRGAIQALRKTHTIKDEYGKSISERLWYDNSRIIPLEELTNEIIYPAGTKPIKITKSEVQRAIKNYLKERGYYDSKNTQSVLDDLGLI